MALLPVRRNNDRRLETSQSDPFSELERLHNQLADYLDAWRVLPSLLGDVFRPPADVEETDDAYLVEVELPGVRRDDLDIEIAGRRVSVRGKREEKQRLGILRKRERTVGQFAYEVTLPGDIDDAHAQANLEEGVLNLRIPKPEHERPRRIEVR